MKTETRSYLTLLALALAYDILLTLPPFLSRFGIDASLVYQFFKPVCHQMDARSFHLLGYKLAVCSRCASIYYGATLGIVFYPFLRPLYKTEMPNQIILAIPLAALISDFALDYLSPIQNTFLSRSITGGALGISTAFFIVPIWISLSLEFSRRGVFGKNKKVFEE